LPLEKQTNYSFTERSTNGKNNSSFLTT